MTAPGCNNGSTDRRELRRGHAPGGAARHGERPARTSCDLRSERRSSKRDPDHRPHRCAVRSRNARRRSPPDDQRPACAASVRRRPDDLLHRHDIERTDRLNRRRAKPVPARVVEPDLQLPGNNDRARLQADAPSSRRPHRRPGARQIPGRPHDHGPRALRRSALAHAVSTDFGNECSR